MPLSFPKNSMIALLEIPDDVWFGLRAGPSPIRGSGYIPNKNLNLSDEQAALLARELTAIIDNDRFFLQAARASIVRIGKLVVNLDTRVKTQLPNVVQGIKFQKRHRGHRPDQPRPNFPHSSMWAAAG